MQGPNQRRTEAATAGALASPSLPAHHSIMAPRTHIWRIDGIEEGVARIEQDGGEMITLPVSLLPSGAKEGHQLAVTRTTDGRRGLTLSIAIDAEGTSAELASSARQTAAALARSRKRDPGGNVAL
jgi:Protein of unknown function (DUF3006)